MQWLHNLDELRIWQSADVNSRPETLWIRGAPGVGKSTIAAYIIDYLRCGYPEAVVGYFFCKQGRPGLTSARDILRTLTYQFVASGKLEDRSSLEELKRTGFDVDNKMGIKFLFEKLLQETIRRVNRKIFIIIDGLDEAEYEVPDDCEPKPQLDILIECLSNLPHIQLLVVSRPPSDVLKVVPLAKARLITIEDNRQDIHMYVDRCISQSERLQRHFKKTNLDPIRFFADQSNGIFLWVTLVLQQLESAKSRKVFELYLKSFSKAPGDMDKLYTNVLSRMVPEDQKWAKEVLKWVLLSPRALAIEELQAVVEKTVEDEHDDFRDFLEVQCGSFLRFVNLPDLPTVQFIHETFRTFITDPTSPCPSFFFIEVDSSNAQIALSCLDALSSAEVGPGENRFLVHASDLWIDYLIAVKPDHETIKPLITGLHRFFTHEGVRNWVRFSLSKEFTGWAGLSISIEETDLSQIIAWLRNAQGSLKETPAQYLKDKPLEESIIWTNMICDGDTAVLLGEIIGTAAANVWSNGHRSELRDLSTTFRLALKYYRKRTDRMFDALQDLDSLVSSRFNDLAVWAGGSAKNPPHFRSVGIAYFLLRRWEEATNCLLSIDDHSINDIVQKWIYLGMASEAGGNYQEAAKYFERAMENHGSHPHHFDDKNISNFLFNLLSNAYVLSGDPLRGIEVLSWGKEKGVCPEMPLGMDFYDPLFRACVIHGYADMAIKLAENAMLMNPLQIWPLYRLSEIYRLKGDYEEEIKALKQVLALDNTTHLNSTSLPSPPPPFPLEPARAPNFPFDVSFRVQVEWCIAQAEMANGDFDLAIGTLQALQEKYPNEDRVAKWLFEMGILISEIYKDKKEYDKAIEVYKKLPTFNPRLYYLCVAEAYFAKGDIHETLTQLRCFRTDGFAVFGDWLAQKGNRDMLAKFINVILEKQVLKYGTFLNTDLSNSLH